MCVYESADAVCPYYRKHSAKRIKCEGRGNGVTVKGWKDADRHIRDVCGNFVMWKKCPIAKRLNEKWEGLQK